MAEKTVEKNQFNWHLSLYTAVATTIVSLSIAIYPDGDVLEFLYVLIVAPVVMLVFLVLFLIFAVRGKAHRGLSFLLTLAVYSAVTWALVRNYVDVRATGRWFLWSKSYKAEVLVQANQPDGQLRHVEWDGWGFPGAGDTVVYLVFDPDNSLTAVTRNHSAGKFSGIPCPVVNARRLENHWYAVTFYTNAEWDHCT